MLNDKRLQRQTDTPIQYIQNTIIQHKANIECLRTLQRDESILENITRTHRLYYIIL